MFLDAEMPSGVQAMVMQMAMVVENVVASGNFFVYSASQVHWTIPVTCGPGSAKNRPSCVTPKSADLNGDGKIDIVDVVLVLDQFGDCVSVDSCTADFDCNNVVD